ncbi:MAG: flagellar hook-associated protein FlgK [Micavibrio sp.]|nr:flagellar hook-associated protein FlgK [Micavibrio sp.]
MTTLSLTSALSGLKAAQRTLDTISTNISNASTEGYTRKILPQETLVVGGIGNGVTLDSIMRNVDKTLLRDLVTQNSVSSGAAVEKSFLDRIQAFHGSSDAQTAISNQIGDLSDAFAALSQSPDNSSALNSVVKSAQQVASTFNKFSDLTTQMRNDANTQISSDVDAVNTQLKNIAQLNRQIGQLTAQGKSTADLEDQRDLAVRNISKYMQVSTYAGDNNQLVVMTKQGQTLVDDNAHQLVFNNTNLAANSYYPGGGANGLFIDSASGPEVTQGQIGGEMGALFKMRDDTLPTYQAQMDELAQKMASRFDQQGLRLFTDSSGNVPASTADPAPTGYVGFSGQIQVNAAVVADPTLLRSGTYGQVVQSGSNEIIRKVSEFAFGAYAYEEGRGTADISAGTLYGALGLTQSNRINGTTSLTSYTPSLDAAPHMTLPASFSIDAGGGPVNITINPGDTATDLVNNINASVGSNVASLSGTGQLVFNAGSDITLGDTGIGTAGMADLGFNFGTFPAQNPSFTVQVGAQSPVTISISPTDTATELLASLNAIPGLSATLSPGGALVMTPTQGGDLTVQNVTGTPLTAMGVKVAGVAQTPMRQSHLGAGGNLSTGLLANSSLADYARSIVTSQAEDSSAATQTATTESTYLTTLDTRNADQSGVNIDEEVAELVRVQTAYSAAARMVSATEKMLDDLLQTVG